MFQRNTTVADELSQLKEEIKKLRDRVSNLEYIQKNEELRKKVKKEEINVMYRDDIHVSDGVKMYQNLYRYLDMLDIFLVSTPTYETQFERWKTEHKLVEPYKLQVYTTNETI